MVSCSELIEDAFLFFDRLEENISSKRNYLLIPRYIIKTDVDIVTQPCFKVTQPCFK